MQMSDVKTIGQEKPVSEQLKEPPVGAKSLESLLWLVTNGFKKKKSHEEREAMCQDMLAQKGTVCLMFLVIRVLLQQSTVH